MLLSPSSASRLTSGCGSGVDIIDRQEQCDTVATAAADVTSELNGQERRRSARQGQRSETSTSWSPPSGDSSLGLQCDRTRRTQVVEPNVPAFGSADRGLTDLFAADNKQHSVDVTESPDRLTIKHRAVLGALPSMNQYRLDSDVEMDAAVSWEPLEESSLCSEPPNSMMGRTARRSVAVTGGAAASRSNLLSPRNIYSGSDLQIETQQQQWTRTTGGRRGAADVEESRGSRSVQCTDLSQFGGSELAAPAVGLPLATYEGHETFGRRQASRYSSLSAISEPLGSSSSWGMLNYQDVSRDRLIAENETLREANITQADMICNLRRELDNVRGVYDSRLQYNMSSGPRAGASAAAAEQIVLLQTQAEIYKEDFNNERLEKQRLLSENQSLHQQVSTLHTELKLEKQRSVLLERQLAQLRQNMLSADPRNEDDARQPLYQRTT